MIAHGLRARRTSHPRAEQIIREEGSVPNHPILKAICVGLSDEQIRFIAKRGNKKVTSRLHSPSDKWNGATTVASTSWIAIGRDPGICHRRNQAVSSGLCPSLGDGRAC